MYSKENKVKCFIEGCEGFYTFSANHNMSNHIKNKAKSELLKRELIDKDLPTPHFDYLKNNYILEEDIKKKIVIK